MFHKKSFFLGIILSILGLALGAELCVLVHSFDPKPISSSPGLGLAINELFLFEEGSSDPATHTPGRIKGIVTALNDFPNEQFIVRGYTSAGDDDQYNQGLSERRANAIKNLLIGYGIDANNITAVGMGESNPIGDNTTASGRATNNRVEFESFPAPTVKIDTDQVPSEKNPTKTTHYPDFTGPEH